MSKSGKKPRKNKMNTRQHDASSQSRPKKEDDWSFEDIARSKTRRR